MDRGAWQATFHGVAKSQTQLSNSHFQFHLHNYSIEYSLQDGVKENFYIMLQISKIFQNGFLNLLQQFELTYNIYRASQAVLVVKNPPANAGDIRDVGSISGLGRFPGEGHGNPLHHFCLRNPMDTGAQPTTVHRIAKSRTRRKLLSTLHARIVYVT